MGREEYFAYSKGDRFVGKKPDEVFSEIEGKRVWEEQESVSGPGSSLEQTAEIRRALPLVFKKFDIQSVLDIPCGDFNWMQKLDYKTIRYTGADIVKKLIESNQLKYQSTNIQFRHLDLLKDSLGKHNLIFCRDCLVHLSYHDISLALKNIKNSGSKYLMTTTFPEEETNKDIPTGGWRPLNFLKPPFNFPEPDYLLNEKCTEGNGLFKDKSLGLWKIDNL